MILATGFVNNQPSLTSIPRVRSKGRRYKPPPALAPRILGCLYYIVFYRVLQVSYCPLQISIRFLHTGRFFSRQALATAIPSKARSLRTYPEWILKQTLFSALIHRNKPDYLRRSSSSPRSSSSSACASRLSTIPAATTGQRSVCSCLRSACAR